MIEKNSLIDSLNIALAKKLTTGYNIKIKSTYANFNPELSLSYGHNGIKHANQLIALMKSEGLVLKFRLNQKLLHTFICQIGENQQLLIL